MTPFTRTLTPVNPVERWILKKGHLVHKDSKGREVRESVLTGHLLYVSSRLDAGNAEYSIDPHQVVVFGLSPVTDGESDRLIECHTTTVFACAQLLESLKPVKNGDAIAVECALGENGVTRVRIHVLDDDQEWIPTPVRESSAPGADRAEIIRTHLADLPRHSAYKPFQSV